MSIELKRPLEETKAPAASANSANARSAKIGPGAAGGFAGLMGLLSAKEPAGELADAAVSETALPLADDAQVADPALALPSDAQTGLVINFLTPVTFLPVAQVPSESAAPAAGSALAAVAHAATEPAAPAAPGALAAVAHAAGKPGADKRPFAGQGDSTLATAAPDGAAAQQAPASDLANLLEQRRATQPQGLSQVQIDLREAKVQQSALQIVSLADATPMAPVAAAADLLTKPQARQQGKGAFGPAGSGLEGGLGGTVADRLGISPSYEVTAASAVVPDTQLAETVSYWVTQGVQSAELTLDGLGTEPVQVHISLQGDQAQIDFRSDQADVRQVIEQASAQLKAMLSGEGLQLTGMSVGTSSQGTAPGEGRQQQPKPAVRQASLLALAPLVASSARVVNPAVGQSLDLYV